MAETQTGAAATSTGTGAGAGTPDAVKAAAEKAAAETKAAADKAAADTKAAADKVAADAAAKAEADKAGKGTAAGAGSTDDSKESKAPDKYELKVPEAGAAFLDDADLKLIETIARQNKWSNDDAQAALEEHVATMQAQSESYLTATKADKAYGGDKLEETQRLAKSVVDKIRPAGHGRRDSFLRFMGRGGAGNHIEVLSFLADLGKAMSEDAPGHTRAAAGGGKSAADSLYDHPTSKVNA